MTEAVLPVKKRVVVVEDESLIRLDVVESLVEFGFDVVAQGANGEEAIQLANEHKPDLVVMDIKMPKLDGISAAEEISKLRIPVVLLTAFSQRELVERASEAGAMAAGRWVGRGNKEGGDGAAVDRAIGDLGELLRASFDSRGGDEILLGAKPTGTLTLDALLPGKRLHLIGTGTGLAPWMSIVTPLRNILSSVPKNGLPAVNASE